MFDFFRKHTRVLQFVLVLLIFPSFVFFGIQGYSRFTGGENANGGQGGRAGHHAGRVGRRAPRPGRACAAADARTSTCKLFDTPGDEDAVARRPGARARDAGRGRQAQPRAPATSACSACSAPTRSSRSCATPTAASTRTLLAAQGMSVGDVRAAPAPGPGDAPGAARRGRHGLRARRQRPARRWTRCSSGARSRCSASTPRTTSAKVNPSDADIETYYKDPANAAQFQAPEQATIEYVVLDLDSAEEGHQRARGRAAQVLRRERERATPRPKSAAPATS